MIQTCFLSFLIIQLTFNLVMVFARDGNTAKKTNPSIILCYHVRKHSIYSQGSK